MQMINSFNSIYEKLHISILSQGYPLLDQIDSLFYNILEDSEISKINQEVLKLFSQISFSIIILIVTIILFKNLILSIQNKEKENVYSILLKIAALYIISNNSEFILKYLLEIFNIFNEIILDFGKNIIKKEISFKNLSNILTKLKIKNNDLFSIEGIINMAICYGTINIIINMSVKYVVFNLFIVLAPIMVLFYYSETTKRISIRWFKNIVYFLISQLLIKVILIFPIMYGKDDLILRVIILGVLYLFYKIDMYLKEIIL